MFASRRNNGGRLMFVLFLFVYVCVEGGREACEFEAVQEFVFISRGDPGGRFGLVLFLFVCG